MADGFVAKLECAICQGVNDYSEYCVLNCGHPFHVVCVEQWLAHSPSATCPSCRAKVNKRSTRVILGVESALEAQGDEAVQQRLQSQQQQVEELQLAVVEKQQQVDQLQLYINKLEDKQDLLQGKLADARARLSNVETAHAAGLQRVNVLTAEKQKQLERHKTDLHKLQRQLHDEEGRSRQLQAAMRRLQLTNPHLTNLAAVQQLAGLDKDGSAQQHQTAADLAATLVQRNTELQQAKQQAQQLQQHRQQLQRQLQVQQDDGEQQLQAAAAQHAAELRLLQEEKEQHMREAIALEYQKDKFLSRCVQQDQKVQQQQQALTTQQQEIEQLKGVLLVLQGGRIPAPVLRDSTRPNRQQGYLQQKDNAPLVAPGPMQSAALHRPKHVQKQPILDSKTKGQPCAATEKCEQSTSYGEQPAGPADSHDALLAELLGDATPSSHTTVDQQRASVDHDAYGAMDLGIGTCEQQQQRNSWQHSNTVQAPQGDVSGSSLGLTFVSSTVLEAPITTVGVPSFIAKAKSGTRAKSAFTIPSQSIRQAPDGKGGLVTHMALNKKRATPYAGKSVTKRHSTFVNAKGNKAEAANGIAAYFNSR